MRRTIVAGWAATLCVLAVGSAGATITGTSGQVTKIAPPPSVMFGDLQSNTTMFAFDEQQNVTLGQALECDITQPGVYDETADLTPGTVPAGTVVSSHFVHADKIGTGPPFVTLEGTVTTDADIICIAILQRPLNMSDFLGAPGTAYPTGDFGRHLELDSQDDFVIEQVDRRTVVIHSSTRLHADQVRIITAAGPCPNRPNAAFGLGQASGYTVLGLSGANVVISQGDTKITGDVGLGPKNAGDLLKATIQGALRLDATASPSIHPDLTVTGGIFTGQNLSGADADARAASAAMAGLAPTQAALGTISGNKTITGGPGLNVVPIAAVDLVKKTLTISGPGNAVFVFNVSGGFKLSSSQIKLVGGVTANNVMWNFPDSGVGDLNIFKAITVAFGNFLAPSRNITIDHTITTGSIIGGRSLKIHSAATVKCP
jgi:choice-of-anchor A domain-containing protein